MFRELEFEGMHAEGINSGSRRSKSCVACQCACITRAVISTGAMPAGHRDLLKSFGLSRNPFTDRTAETTTLDGIAHYNHSDLQGFAPSGHLFAVLRIA